MKKSLFPFMLGLLCLGTKANTFPVLMYGRTSTQINDGLNITRNICVNSSQVSDTSQLILQVMAYRAGYRRIIRNINGSNVDYRNRAKFSVQTDLSSNRVNLTNNFLNNNNPRRNVVRAGGINGQNKIINIDIPMSRFTTSNALASQSCFDVTYSYNGSEGFTSGMVVVDTKVLAPQANGDLLDITQARVWNESDHHGTVQGGSASRGNTLFSQANILNENLFEGSPTLSASCVSCHAEGGRDLHFYGFSNDSIINRAIFHGLNEQDGKDIASYIRQFNSNANVPVLGRPWNPPFQPGPHLDGVTDKKELADKWNAGAGFEWYLPESKGKDNYIVKKIFNITALDEITQSKVDELYKGQGRAFSTINVNEIPTAIQMPEWNEWLPLFAPEDVFKLSANPNFFFDSPAYVKYTLLKENLANWKNSSDPYKVMDEFSNFWDIIKGTFNNWREASKGLSRFDNVDYFAIASSNGYSREDARKSLISWGMVKTWELVREFELETFGNEKFPNTWELVSWPVAYQFSVFAKAPHIIANNRSNFRISQGADTNNTVEGQSILQGKTESTQWYHLQLLLNPGFKERTNFPPSDWPYHFIHISSANRQANTVEQSRFGNVEYSYNDALRYLVTHVKGIQMRDQGASGIPDLLGWALRYTHPMWLVAGNNDVTKNNLKNDVIVALDQIYPDLHRMMINAYMKVFNEKAELFTQQNRWIYCDAAVQTNPGLFSWFCLPNQVESYHGEISDPDTQLFKYPGIINTGDEETSIDQLMRLINVRGVLFEYGVQREQLNRFDAWILSEYPDLELVEYFPPIQNRYLFMVDPFFVIPLPNLSVGNN